METLEEIPLEAALEVELTILVETLVVPLMEIEIEIPVGPTVGAVLVPLPYGAPLVG